MIPRFAEDCNFMKAKAAGLSYFKYFVVEEAGLMVRPEIKWPDHL